MSGQVLDQVINRGHGLAVILANLQVELALAPQEDLAHIERVQTERGEGLGQSDLGRVFASVVEADKADDALGDGHRVSIVVTLLTRHQNIVRIVGATLDGSQHGHAIEAGCGCGGSETLSEEAL